uniref:RUN domaincontaining protein 1like [Aplysia californica] n=1 Tax=Lepeophtheirus salmonis TaxID=72036 RepID=A0A0K2T746_LEPSM
MSAPDGAKDNLLKELENFAFRSIPSVVSTCKIPSNSLESSSNQLQLLISSKGNEVATDEIKNNELLEIHRQRQTALINQLKEQLEELETYAYESGDGVIPSNILLERQRIVMDQLKAQLNFNLDNIDTLSDSELKTSVDNAVRDIINPLKMKSHLVNQLKTQITDLEMFIHFLQDEMLGDQEPCGCKKHEGLEVNRRKRTPSEREEIRAKTVNIMERAMAVLQIAATSQFGCSAMNSQQFQSNVLKGTPKGNHYGDLRARLEISVDHVLETCSQVECITDTDCTSIVSSENPETLIDSPRVTQIVRRELSVAIRDLMQHGMIEYGRNAGKKLVPFLGCATPTSSRYSSTVHPWNVIIRFYDMKGGRDYNSATSRKLSQSFGLNLDANAINPKQSFLSTIGSIISTHKPYKRSSDAQFKAFICAGLNQRKLIPWLKLIVKNQHILEIFYQPWSYVVKTNFDDAFRSIERLSLYGFNLPVDVAVKQFQDMSEAF